jgi:hypothetical protein
MWLCYTKMLTWLEYADWTTDTCSEDADFTNYKDENQNLHKLNGRKPKFAQNSLNLLGPDLKSINVKNSFTNSISQ